MNTYHYIVFGIPAAIAIIFIICAVAYAIKNKNQTGPDAYETFDEWYNTIMNGRWKR